LAKDRPPIGLGLAREREREPILDWKEEKSRARREIRSPKEGLRFEVGKEGKVGFEGTRESGFLKPTRFSTLKVVVGFRSVGTVYSSK